MGAQWMVVVQTKNAIPSVRISVRCRLEVLTSHLRLSIPASNARNNGEKTKLAVGHHTFSRTTRLLTETEIATELSSDPYRKYGET